jgi:hypothetical protein
VEATAFASELWSSHLAGGQSLGNFMDGGMARTEVMGLGLETLVDIVGNACSAAYGESHSDDCEPGLCRH